MVSRRLAELLDARSASVELGVVAADDRRVAIPLTDGESRIGSLVLPADLPAAQQERVRERVVPVLESVLAAALTRERLQADVVETAALRRSDEMKTAVLRSVSHDLRTPVTAMLAGISALRSASVTGDEREQVEADIADSATRLSVLIDKLLDLSRLQAGTAAPNRDLVVGRRGAARSGRPRRRRRLPVLRRPAAAARARRRRAAGARVRQPVGERRALRRRPAGLGPRPRGRRPADGPHRRPRPGHPGLRAGADLHAVLPRRGDRAVGRRARASAWPSRAASSRPTAARSPSSRCPGRGRRSSSRCRSRPSTTTSPRRRSTGCCPHEPRRAGPRLRRRPADPARAARRAARRGLRRRSRRDRGGGAGPHGRPPARGRDHRPDAPGHRRRRGLPPAARVEPDPGDRAVGGRRGGREGSRAARRRRRLRHQAVLARRAAGAAGGRAAARRRARRRAGPRS